MGTISICSKRQFCFTHPDFKTSEAVQGAMARRGHNQPLEGTFTVKALPLQAQEAPDWITQDPLFQLAEKDGDIFLVPTPPPMVSVPGKIVPPTPSDKKPEDATGGDLTKPNGPGPIEEAEPVDLNAMSKAQIVDHAAELHGLELDPTARKADLIEAVQEAQTQKGK